MKRHKMLPFLLALYVYGMPVSGESVCPDGWQKGMYDDDFCFKEFKDVKLAMDDAENYCQDFGAHLASFHSDQEYAPSNDDYVWIGLRQKPNHTEDRESDFEWIDGTPVDLMNFRK